MLFTLATLVGTSGHVFVSMKKYPEEIRITLVSYFVPTQPTTLTEWSLIACIAHAVSVESCTHSWPFFLSLVHLPVATLSTH